MEIYPSTLLQEIVLRMTSSISWKRWRMYLAFILVCQTARRVEGHPRGFTEVSQDTRNSSTQDALISRLIETAYERQELLRPEQWSRQTNDHQLTRSVVRDTSRQSEYLMDDGFSTPGERRLLEAPNRGTSIRIDTDEIIFPTDYFHGSTSSIPISASACRNSTFCENVPNYPRQLVNAAIARNATLRFLESIDPTPVEQRIDTTDEPLCRYREQVVFPQTAQNKDKQWLFIVNNDNLKQGIRVEICTNENKECNMIRGFAEGYQTSCKQKFIYRELAALGSDGSIIKDQFRFPSSCCCHVKFIGDPNVRLGLGLERRPFNRTIKAVSNPRDNEESGDNQDINQWKK